MASCPTLTSLRNCGKITPPVGDRLVVGHVTLDYSTEVRILVPQQAEKETPSHEGVFVSIVQMPGFCEKPDSFSFAHHLQSNQQRMLIAGLPIDPERQARAVRREVQPNVKCIISGCQIAR